MELSDPNPINDIDISDDDLDDTQLDVNSHDYNQRLLQAHADVEANPYNYDSHEKYVSLLRLGSDLQTLRYARENMSNLFPLKPGIWLDWIQGEIQLATSETEKEEIVSLFKKAIEDYQSVEVWTAYVSFMREWILEKSSASLSEGIRELRSLYLQGLGIVGHDFNSSHLYFHVIKDFEIGFLQSQSQSRSSIDQVVRIKEMFKARLKIPHREIENTYVDYTSFLSQYDPQNYESEAKEGSNLLSTIRNAVFAREKQELNLKDNDYSLEAFMAYTQFEKQHTKDPNTVFRVRILFERTVLVHGHNPDAWINYVMYVMMHLKVRIVVRSVTDRALRHCFYTSELWSHALFARELFPDDPEPEAVNEEIQELYDRALAYIQPLGDSNALVNLILTRCAIQKRKVILGTELGEAAFEVLLQIYDQGRELVKGIPGGDPSKRIDRSLAQFHVHVTKDVHAARTIYEEFVKDRPSCVAFWLEFIEFEKHHAPQRVTRLFKQAANRKLDDPNTLFTSWLDFELAFGTVESYFAAYERSLIELAKYRIKSIAGSFANLSSIDPPAHVLQAAMETAERQQMSPVSPASPTMLEIPLSKKRSIVDLTQSNKKIKPYESPRPSMEEDDDISKRAKPTIDQYKVVDNSMAGHMIYLGNLSSRTTEEMIRSVFVGFGRILDLAMGPNQETGALESFIEFESVEPVKQVIELGSFNIAGDQILPKRCRPSEMVWRFKATEEKNKIYVSQLPTTVDKKKLRDLFSEFGKIQEIRLVLKKSTAFAYIDFESEKAASKSLSLNGHVIVNGKPPISVAISDPRKTKKMELDARNLFVTNVADSLLVPDLEKLFGQYGLLKSVRRPEGKRGLAFVNFEKEDDAREALKQLNGKMVDGRVLTVTISDPNMKRGKTLDQRLQHPKITSSANSHKASSSSVPSSHHRNSDAMDEDNKVQPASSTSEHTSLSFKPRSTRKNPKKKI